MAKRTAEMVELTIPTNFDLFSTVEQIKKLPLVSFKDRPQEDWATDKYIPQTKEHFEEMLHYLSQYQDITCDVETNGLSFADPRVHVVGHVLCANGKSYYVPIRHITNEPQLNADYVNGNLRELIYQNKDKRTIWHNAKFDYNQLLKEGIDMSFRFKDGTIFDTQIMWWYIDENFGDDEHYYFLRNGQPAEKTKWIGGMKGHLEKAKAEGAVKLQGYSLKALAPKLVGLPMTKFDDILSKVTFDKLPLHFGGKYARLDGVATEQLFIKGLPLLEKEGLLQPFIKVDMPFVEVLANMERRGLGLSRSVLKRIGERCEEELETLSYEIKELCGGSDFNINSGKQIGDILYNKLGYPILARTAKGAPKTDSATMEKLAEMGYELPLKLQKYNKLNKTLGTYVNGFLEQIDVDGRIHSSFHQTGTVTGRLSSSNPNLQNLTSFPIFEDELNREQMIAMRKSIGDLGINKKFDFTVHFLDEEGEPLGTEEGWEDKCVKVVERWYVRDAFNELDYLNPTEEDLKNFRYGYLDMFDKIKDELVYVVCDLNQMELRIMAHFSADPTLIDAFEKGQDIHKRTAAEVNEVEFDKVTKDMRKGAKAVNFGLIYGKTPFGFAMDWYSDEPDFWVPSNWAEEGKEPASKYIDMAKGFINKYFEAMPLVKTFMDNKSDFLKTYGYVKTIIGRKRRIKEVFSQSASERNKALRQAVNTIVQGSSADWIKLAMIKVENRLKEEGLFAYQLLSVHDEIVVVTRLADSEKVKQIVQDSMENVAKLKCPIKAEPTCWYRYGSAK